MVVGVFGTTISPYLFFWQASEEVEDMQRGKRRRWRASARRRPELRRIRWDTWSGMFYSDITAYFIILATAVTLNVAGVTDIETAAQAASALRPLAGDFAFMLFALGILWRRTDRGSGARRLRRLRACRGHGLEMGPRAAGHGRARLLRRHCLSVLAGW